MATYLVGARPSNLRLTTTSGDPSFWKSGRPGSPIPIPKITVSHSDKWVIKYTNIWSEINVDMYNTCVNKGKSTHGSRCMCKGTCNEIFIKKNIEMDPVLDPYFGRHGQSLSRQFSVEKFIYIYIDFSVRLLISTLYICICKGGERMAEDEWERICNKFPSNNFANFIRSY